MAGFPNMTKYNFIFTCNDNRMETRFNICFQEEVFKEELKAAFMVVAQYINQASRKRRVILFDNIFYMRSASTGTSDIVISPEDSEDLQINVTTQNSDTILISVENLKNEPKYNDWFRKAVSYYYCARVNWVNFGDSELNAKTKQLCWDCRWMADEKVEANVKRKNTKDITP